MEHTTLEQRIMKRVTRTYYLKKVINRVALKVYALILAIGGMASLVSITNVFENMPPVADVYLLYRFIMSAIVNTELSVQLVLGVVVIVSGLLVRDTIKNFTYGSRVVGVHSHA